MSPVHNNGPSGAFSGARPAGRRLASAPILPAVPAPIEVINALMLTVLDLNAEVDALRAAYDELRAENTTLRQALEAGR